MEHRSTPDPARPPVRRPGHHFLVRAAVAIVAVTDVVVVDFQARPVVGPASVAFCGLVLGFLLGSAVGSLTELWLVLGFLWVVGSAVGTLLSSSVADAGQWLLIFVLFAVGLVLHLPRPARASRAPRTS